MKFTKMQALGNDFVCIKGDDAYRYNLKIFSKYICDRHYGIGADGLILILKSSVADVKMRIFNKDGSEAGMCGNGIRCLGKYIYEKGIISKKEAKIETSVGIKNIEYILENKKVLEMRVNMGKPILDANKIPIYTPYIERKVENNEINKLQFKIKDKEYIGSCLSVGNPHTVVEVDDLDNINIEKVGSIIENYKYYPNKTNVEFVKVINNKLIKVKVWERGVGRTLSCGTGACASFVACFLNKKVERSVRVNLEGGYLDLELDDKEDIILKGDANFVYEGSIDL